MTAELTAGLERIVKLARVAAPSGNASPNERQQAATMIGAIASGLMKGGPSPAPPPPPPPRQWDARRYWREIFEVDEVPHGLVRALADFRDLSDDDLRGAMDTTVRKVRIGSLLPSAALRYFCGICWRLKRGQGSR